MTDIFVSYAVEDTAFAQSLVARLEAGGATCWIAPRDIQPGEDYGASIATAIQEAALLVIVFSAHSNDSRHVLRELELADRAEKPIVPVRIDDSEATGGMAYRLATVQWIAGGPTLISDEVVAGILSALTRTRRSARTSSTPDFELPASMGVEEVSGPNPGIIHAGDVLPPLDWSGSSARDLKVPIGLDGTGAVVELTLGDDPVHGLIGGHTGTGKTNLVRILIEGLASRYSPDEVAFCLIDGMHGVEFAPFRILPHTRAAVHNVAENLDAAIALLQGLDGETRDRFRGFRGASVRDFAAYRASGGRLPRIVLIIEEYASLLRCGARLSDIEDVINFLVVTGRASGIHVLLCSQGVPLPLAHQSIGLRIAFRGFYAASEAVLGPGNGAAVTLREAGDAIVNDKCGQPSANRRIRVALVDPVELGDRVQAIAQRGSADVAAAHGVPIDAPAVTI